MKPILLYALRELGPAALLRIMQYRLGIASGWTRKLTRDYDWDERPLAVWLKPEFSSDPIEYARYRSSGAPKLFLPEPETRRERLPALLGEGRDAAVAAADDIADGRFTLFGCHQPELGFPPDWHQFAPLVEGIETTPPPKDRHWTEIDLEGLTADVKLLWEVNRFGWVYPLMRVQAITAASESFEVFWSLFESWRRSNPPNRGLNWQSGQEVGIRMLALIFALYAMNEEFSARPDRMVEICQTIAAHADRIPPTLSYAVAQGNNHLLVEAVALYSAGSLFPEFKMAENWRRAGRRWLEHALHEQVLSGGGYVQHSVNYHRLALQAGLWAARLADILGEPLSSELLRQIEGLVRWLAEIVDADTGAAPNYGPNDGAQIIPLSMLPFDDHRPVIQAASRLLQGEALYPPGAWDEWSLWLGVLDSQDEAPRPITRANKGLSQVSDLYQIRGDSSRLFIRTGRYTNRPGHADQLHADLWLGAQNIALDPGTYLYNADSPWENALSSARYHNTILVDGEDAMIRAGRFLWLKWDQSSLLGSWSALDGRMVILSSGRYADMARRIFHRRTVVCAVDEQWLFVDDLIGDGRHRIDLNWMVPDLPYTLDQGNLLLRSPVGEVQLTVENGESLMRLYRAGKCVSGPASDQPTETFGWFSPTYAYKIPALQTVYQWDRDLPLRIVSRWSRDESIRRSLEVTWNTIDAQRPPLSRVEYRDQYLETNDAYSVDPSSVRINR